MHHHGEDGKTMWNMDPEKGTGKKPKTEVFNIL